MGGYEGMEPNAEHCKKPIRFSTKKFVGNLFCTLTKGHSGLCDYEYLTSEADGQ